MRRDSCCSDRDGEARERAERLIFAGSGGKCYLGGGSLQRPIHLSSWHPSWRGVGVRVGGVKWRGTGGGGYDEGLVLSGSQPKSRTRLMGSPPLRDPSLENWSRHPDSCLPPALPTVTGLGMQG